MEKNLHRGEIENELYVQLDNEARKLNVKWSRPVARLINKKIKKYSARPGAAKDVTCCGIGIDEVWVDDIITAPHTTNDICIGSDPAEARHIATEAAESNAPPTAPPNYNATQSTLEAILPSICTEMADTDTTPSQIFRHLDQPEIRNYIVEKIARKAYTYPHLLPLVWHTTTEFRKFEKSIKGEIYRLLLTILKNRNAHKAAPILVFARESLNRHEVSIDATLPCAGDGEKAISYHDIIADPAGDPLSILIEYEHLSTEAAIINALTENEKNRIIAEFEEKEKIKKCELFFDDYETEPEAADKRLNLEKYRRKSKSKSPGQRQLELFAVAVNAGGAM